MNGTKPWYQSLTVWSSFATLLAGVLSLFHFAIDPQLVADVANWLLAVATVVGGAVSLWGRLRASRRIAPPPDWNRYDALLLAVMALPLLLLAGCAAFTAPSPDYVAADRATYEAVAPEYADYVHADPSLGADEVARRERTLRTWLLRIEQAARRTPAATQPTDPFAEPAARPSLETP
jgi:hypothetical protein